MIESDNFGHLERRFAAPPYTATPPPTPRIPMSCERDHTDVPRYAPCSYGGEMNRSQSGMTLLELMIAVAIVGILAAVAIFAYNKYIKKAKSGEVAAMMAEFKLRQEQYHVENGSYLSTGATEADKHPATPAGSADPQDITAGWPATWTTLRMNPDKEYLYCSYVTIAGAAGTKPSGAKAISFGFTSNAALNWYYVLAECDWDDDSTTNEFRYAQSNLDGIAIENQGK